mgnify:CR=1 FL=1
MKGIQYSTYSTKKELYEAKKILYEGNNVTKKTFLVALAALVIFFAVMLIRNSKKHKFYKKL